jgi:hypothetical protein
MAAFKRIRDLSKYVTNSGAQTRCGGLAIEERRVRRGPELGAQTSVALGAVASGLFGHDSIPLDSFGMPPWSRRAVQPSANFRNIS